MKNNNQYRERSDGSRTVTTLVLAVVAVWFLAAFTGGLMNLFSGTGGPPLPVGIFLVIPVGGFTLAYAINSRVRYDVDQIPLWVITIAHVWRFVGLGFVIGALIHVLPPQFGFPEGLGDFVTALFCLPLALAIRKGSHAPGLRAAFIAWNVFGLIDLLSAISMGILYSESSFGVLRTGLSTALMTTFPVNLIPTFFLPLFILFHMLALKRRGEITHMSDNRCTRIAGCENMGPA
ncbi:MAG TPA: hypothetical protein VLG72_03405 [Nitrospirota bacterium]|nr:hypothetical protein [Nitrospirota bacterium]